MNLINTNFTHLSCGLFNLNTPKIVVILAVYNGINWIGKQTHSILNQDNVNVSVFTSIDLSEDSSREFCIQTSEHYKNFAVLPCVGRLGDAAKNFFRLMQDVDLTDFEYLSFADQDDIWDITKLSLAIKMLKETEADAYSSNVTAFWPDGKIKLIDKAQTQRQFDYMFESAGPGCTFVLTQKLALDLQNFLKKNQQACENVALHDWFIYAFARIKGYKWVIDKVPHMQYRQHSNNVIGANVGLKAKLVRWQKLRAGWLSSQAILLAEIIGYNNHQVILRLKRNNFTDRLVLAFSVGKFRRKLTDRLVLAASFLVGKN